MPGRAAVAEQNRQLLERQRRFRIAADCIVDVWMAFPEVEAIAVIGSCAQALWKEVPRFKDYRQARIQVWHECKDLDLALWLGSQHRLDELRKALLNALGDLFKTQGIGVAQHQADVFLFDPSSDAYLGRLCGFGTCPKGHADCMVTGCGTIAFNKVVEGFKARPGILAPAEHAMLYRKGQGRIGRAVDLPVPAGIAT